MFYQFRDKIPPSMKLASGDDMKIAFKWRLRRRLVHVAWLIAPTIIACYFFCASVEICIEAPLMPLFYGAGIAIALGLFITRLIEYDACEKKLEIGFEFFWLPVTSEIHVNGHHRLVLEKKQKSYVVRDRKGERKIPFTVLQLNLVEAKNGSAVPLHEIDESTNPAPISSLGKEMSDRTGLKLLCPYLE
ncbi:MAG: hypothetical protein E3J72_11295 [Planctomycetota bacterium]|nr:MAG: hypothetical protein E3J72_11295 [Planctomycetota bacterium]